MIFHGEPDEHAAAFDPSEMRQDVLRRLQLNRAYAVLFLELMLKASGRTVVADGGDHDSSMAFGKHRCCGLEHLLRADDLDHLSEDGVLVITRPEAHLPRLFVTARAVLEDRSLSGLEQKVLAWRQPSSKLSFVAGFALRKKPFSGQEVESFSQILAHRGLEPLFLPGGTGVHPYPRLLTDPDVQSVKIPFAFRNASDGRLLHRAAPVDL